MMLELQKQCVYCRYKKYGCHNENVTYETLVQHMSECRYGSGECSNEVRGCTARISCEKVNWNKKEYENIAVY